MKGLIKRYSETSENRTEDHVAEPISLHLCGNPSIGDAGAAALAAALRIINQENQNTDDDSLENNPAINQPPQPILDTLDLSSCDISDTGAESLALALEGNPRCVKNLILSNNRITDKGATAIGNALVSTSSHGYHTTTSPSPTLEYLNVDNNKEIGDQGAKAIASAMEQGILEYASLRSCSIGADGSMAFGRVVPKLAFMKRSEMNSTHPLIDLSGNQLGIYRAPKAKKGKALLKSKASATTASAFNFLGKKIKGGLKDVAGVDISQYLPATSAESDDDFEENDSNIDKKSKDKVDLDKMVTSTKCGARAFADALVNSEQNDKHVSEKGDMNDQERASLSGAEYSIGMRLCSLDKGGADAFAALIIQAKKLFGLKLSIDASMNSALDTAEILALDNAESDDETLEEMATRHLDALEALRLAQERALEASSANEWDNVFSWEEDEYIDSFSEDEIGYYDKDEDSNDIYDEYAESEFD